MKKQRNILVENKGPLPKYTNYHSPTTPLDHIYAVKEKSLCRQPEAIKSNKSRRDVKKNYAFHEDIGHNTKRYVPLRDEIERLMMVGHFKKFIDEPQTMNREEQPRQQSPEKVREVLAIIGGSHLVGESRCGRDKYAKEAKTSPQIHVHRTDERPTRCVQREIEDIVFTEVGARWVHHPHTDALVITAKVANNSVH